MKNYLLTFLFLSFFSLAGFAFETMPVKSSQIISSFDKTIELNQGEDIHIKGIFNYNLQGEKQLFIYLKESHLFNFETEQLVVIGKDINDDGRIDTWFYQTDNGTVNFIQRTLKTDSDFDGMKVVFSGIFDSAGRWAIGIMARFAFENLTLTGSVEYSFWAKYEIRQIELLDMELRLNELHKKFPKDLVLNEFRKNIDNGWQALLVEFNNHNGTERFKMVGADIGLFVAGSLVFRGIGAAARFTMQKLGWNEIMTSLVDIGEKHYRFLKTRVANARYQMIFPKAVTNIRATPAFQILVRLSKIPILERPAIMIEDLVLKSRLTQAAMKNYGFFLEGIKEVSSQKGYIAFSASIQLGTEIMTREYLSVDDKAIILDSPIQGTNEVVKKVASKVASDKSLLQNLAYMTFETADTAAISKVLLLNGVPTWKRLMICGMASTVSSISMAKFVKGEVNTAHVAGDTAWEVVIGNSQVLFDIWQWRKFGELADKTGIQPLRLVGFVVTFAHQSVGYYYYSKSSAYLDKLGEDKTKMPVDPKQKIHKDPLSDLRPILVPILAPDVP